MKAVERQLQDIHLRIRSRKNSPVRSANHDFIAQQIGEALRSLTSIVTAKNPDPQPQVNMAAKIPNSGLEKFRSRKVSNSFGAGGFGMPINFDLQNLVLTLQKQLKEQNEQIQQIWGVPPIIKGMKKDKLFFTAAIKTQCNATTDIKEIQNAIYTQV